MNGGKKNFINTILFKGTLIHIILRLLVMIKYFEEWRALTDRVS